MQGNRERLCGDDRDIGNLLVYAIHCTLYKLPSSVDVVAV